MSWNGRGADFVPRRSHECRGSHMRGARLGASTLGIGSAVPSCHGPGYIPIEPLIQTPRCPPLPQPHPVPVQAVPLRPAGDFAPTVARRSPVRRADPAARRSRRARSSVTAAERKLEPRRRTRLPLLPASTAGSMRRFPGPSPGSRCLRSSLWSQASDSAGALHPRPLHRKSHRLRPMLAAGRLRCGARTSRRCRRASAPIDCTIAS